MASWDHEDLKSSSNKKDSWRPVPVTVGDGRTSYLMARGLEPKRVRVCLCEPGAKCHGCATRESMALGMSGPDVPPPSSSTLPGHDIDLHRFRM